MKILNRDVKPAEAPTAPASPTVEQKEPVEAPETIEEAPKVDKKEWDNQPKSSTLYGDTSENKKEEEAKTDKENVNNEIEGLSKAKERLILDIQSLREEKKALKEKPIDKTVEEEIDYQTEEEGEDERINRILDSRDAKNNFYNSNPTFYNGPDGFKNRQLVEDYINLKYNSKNMSASAVTELREMVHNKFFGTYDKDMTIQQAKDEARQEHIQNELSTMGSDRGKSFTRIQSKPRKRILPQQKGPQSWYSSNK